VSFEPSDDDWSIRVCYAHGKVNVCRVGMYGDPDSCEWTEDPDKVEAVQGYQAGRYEDWK
jgi:hypothetical protein